MCVYIYVYVYICVYLSMFEIFVITHKVFRYNSGVCASVPMCVSVSVTVCVCLSKCVCACVLRHSRDVLIAAPVTVADIKQTL